MPIVVAPIAGVLSDRVGGRPLLVAGMAMMAVGLGWIAAVSTPTVEYLAMVPAFVLAGSGMSLFFAPTANLVLSAVKPDEEGRASGANNTIREIGGVFGVAVLASVFSANGSYASPQAFVDGMVPAVWVGAAAVGLASIAALAIPGRRLLAGAHLPGVPALPELRAPQHRPEVIRVRADN
jgi:MFS family permease